MCGETQLLDYFDKLGYNQFHTKPCCLFNLNCLQKCHPVKTWRLLFFFSFKKKSLFIFLLLFGFSVLIYKGSVTNSLVFACELGVWFVCLEGQEHPQWEAAEWGADGAQ